MLTMSNFQVAGKEEEAVAISQGVPKGWKGKRYLKLAPPWSLVKDKSSEFTKKYYEQVLSRLNAAEVVKELKELAGEDAILLCWEGPGKFCHRMVVAEWLKIELGIEVKEWQRPEEGSPEDEERKQKRRKRKAHEALMERGSQMDLFF